MTDLHIISENDELSVRNGSAVLRVAQELQKAALAAGTMSWIGGGAGKLVDLERAVEILEAPNNGGALNPLLKRLSQVSKYALGASLTSPRVKSNTAFAPDNIYCHNQPWIADAVRRAYPGAKIHLYVHNKVLNSAPPSTIRTVIGRFDSVITVSNFIRKDLLLRARLHESRRDAIAIRTVYNGVDCSRFSLKHSEEKSVDVVFLGRVIPDKGVHVLAEAMSKLSGTLRCSLRIVGGSTFLPDGRITEYEQSVFSVLKASGIDYSHTGPVPPHQVPALINSSRIIVVPSVWDDPCPLVFLEGLASEAGVIATRVGGMPEVGDKAGAIFVPADDPEQLAVAMFNTLGSEDIRKELVEAGQDWASKRGWPVVYEELNSPPC